MRPRAPASLTTAAAVLIALALLAISPYALLVMLPALALAWSVALGLFTGEQATAWVRAALRRARPRRARNTVAAPRLAPWVSPRGGLLIAAGLASRPPPAS